MHNMLTCRAEVGTLARASATLLCDASPTRSPLTPRCIQERRYCIPFSTCRQIRPPSHRRILGVAVRIRLGDVTVIKDWRIGPPIAACCYTQVVQH